MPLLPAEHALFARVLDAPDDPAPRQVLADALIDRGEPYGEFLRLQSGGGPGAAARSRARTLREGDVLAFLGPIARVTGRERTWRHGLLHGVLLKPTDPAALDACADDPLWGTVRQVSVSGSMSAHAADLLRWVTDRAPWRWLERVRLAGPAHFEALARNPSFAVRELHGAFMTPDHLASLGDSRRFPLLREVVSDVVPLTPAHAGPRLRALHRRPLDVVGFGLHPVTLPVLVGFAEGSAARTVRFEGAVPGWPSHGRRGVGSRTPRPADPAWRLEVDPRTWSWTATARADTPDRDVVHGLLRRVDRRFVADLSFA